MIKNPLEIQGGFLLLQLGKRIRTYYGNGNNTDWLKIGIFAQEERTIRIK